MGIVTTVLVQCLPPPKAHTPAPTRAPTRTPFVPTPLACSDANPLATHALRRAECESLSTQIAGGCTYKQGVCRGTVCSDAPGRTACEGLDATLECGYDWVNAICTTQKCTNGNNVANCDNQPAELECMWDVATQTCQTRSCDLAQTRNNCNKMDADLNCHWITGSGARCTTYEHRCGFDAPTKNKCNKKDPALLCVYDKHRTLADGTPEPCFTGSCDSAFSQKSKNKCQNANPPSLKCMWHNKVCATGTCENQGTQVLCNNLNALYTDSMCIWQNPTCHSPNESTDCSVSDNTGKKICEGTVGTDRQLLGCTWRGGQKKCANPTS